jgi:hypothetical protein
LINQVVLPDEPANLSLGDRTLEQVGRQDRGEVEEGSGGSRDPDAVERSGVTAVE